MLLKHNPGNPLLKMKGNEKMAKKILAFALSALLLFNTFTFLASAKDEDISADFLYGDVNGNGKVDFFDSVYLFFAGFGFFKLSEAQNLAADVNGDGKVDRADRKLITQYGFRSISTFPVETASWGEGTPIETKYDENGKPDIMLLRAFRGTPLSELKATYTGSVAIKDSDITIDFEIGIHQTDVYMDITARKLSTLNFRSNIANVRFIEKDLNADMVVPALFVYIDLIDESGLSEEEKATMRAYISMFAEYKDEFMSIFTDTQDFANSLYKGSSIVQVGNAKYLCENYGDFRCYFTSDGTLRRIEPVSSGDQMSVMIFSEKTDVNMSKFNIPAIYRKVTLAELMDMIKKLG